MLEEDCGGRLANWYLVKPHSMEELTALVGRFKKFWLEGAKDRGRQAA